MLVYMSVFSGQIYVQLRMLGKLELIGPKRIFTGEDDVPVELTLKRKYTTASCAALVKSVDIRIKCEGNFSIDGESHKLNYYESEPTRAHCASSTSLRAIYSAVLRLPRSSDLPSSLYLDGEHNGIRWFVTAVVRLENNQFLHVKRILTFVQSAELPTLLDLVETEYTKQIGGSEISMITTHAAAGLPQVPLAAGIGLDIETTAVNKFSICRLRVLLNEHTCVSVNEYTKQFPVRRWLLYDHRFPRDLMLCERQTCLDAYTSDIRLDHSRMPPTFSTRHLEHTFRLNVELTITWDEGNQVKQINSIYPVNVLPRVLGADFVPTRASQQYMTVHYDSAEITDSSESSLSEYEEEVSEVFHNVGKEDSVRPANGSNEILMNVTFDL